MKVFISWSGARSKAVAETLRSWLPRTIQSVKPWMSDEDISAGARWLNEVSSQLAGATVGIICVTPENQSSPWLLFEAGALSKSIEQSLVCPFLYDLTVGQLTGPLSQFQASPADREGTYRIFSTLNKALGGSQLLTDDLEEIFEVWWPRLEISLDAIGELAKPPTGPGRTSEEVLEEVLGNTREQLRRENIRLQQLREREDRMEKFMELQQSALLAMSSNMRNSQASMLELGEHLAGGGIVDKESLAVVRDLVGRESPMDALKKMMLQMKEMSTKEKGYTEALLGTAALSGDTDAVNS